MNILRTNLFKSKRDLTDTRITVAPGRYKTLIRAFLPYPVAWSPCRVLEYINLARVCFPFLSRKQNAKILKPMTQDLVLCSGVPAHLWERERGLLHIPGHHTCLMGVSRQHLDLFKQSHRLGHVPYFV